MDEVDKNVMVLMRGVPGSGKSTVAQAIAERIDAAVLSTDQFWYQMNGNDLNTYDYNPDRLGEAHQWNIKRTAMAMWHQRNVIIDNTNISEKAMKPYKDLAQALGYSVSVVYVNTDVETCIARQATRPKDRQVPEEVIRRMAAQLEGK